MIINFKLFESKGKNIGPLYHGSGSIFKKFSDEELGGNSKDPHILNYLGFHFTPDFKMAERLFASAPNFVVYNVEITINKTLKIIEGDLVREMLKWGAENNYFDTKKVNLEQLLNLRYDSETGQSINTCLWTDRNRLIDKKKLALGYKQHLIELGYDSIKYLNEIEWKMDKRYDWIVFKNNQVKIINIYKEPKKSLKDK